MIWLLTILSIDPSWCCIAYGVGQWKCYIAVHGFLSLENLGWSLLCPWLLLKRGSATLEPILYQYKGLDSWEMSARRFESSLQHYIIKRYALEWLPWGNFAGRYVQCSEHLQGQCLGTPAYHALVKHYCNAYIWYLEPAFPSSFGWWGNCFEFGRRRPMHLDSWRSVSRWSITIWWECHCQELPSRSRWKWSWIDDCRVVALEIQESRSRTRCLRKLTLNKWISWD